VLMPGIPVVTAIFILWFRSAETLCPNCASRWPLVTATQISPNAAQYPHQRGYFRHTEERVETCSGNRRVGRAGRRREVGTGREGAKREREIRWRNQ